MDHISELIRISRYFGSDPEYVLAGGGNTSYKDDKKIWIKASGTSLSTIDKSGFLCLSRDGIGEISKKQYPEKSSEREAQITSDLLAAVIENGSGRPSVETSLHNLFNHPFIVHTHPTIVNALLCSLDAGYWTRKLFGEDVLYIEYTDPGYTLFIETRNRLKSFRAEMGRDPSVVFLQNHGLIVGGNSFEEIERLSVNVLKVISNMFKYRMPEQINSELGLDKETLEVVDLYFRKNNINIEYRANKLISSFIEGVSRFGRVSRPFTPDDIVYCKANYLFIASDAGDIVDEIEKFKLENSYQPQIIALEKRCLIAAGKSPESARIAMDVFVNMIKISYLSENFGGPNFLTDSEIEFIENWEAENYRRNVI